MLKHREHSDIVQIIRRAMAITRIPLCDWRCCDQVAMIIGPSPGILYAGFNEDAVLS
jgi:hypothetical protein